MYQQPILCTVWCRFWYISFWQQWFIRSVKKASGILLSGLVDDKNAGVIF